MKRKVCMIITVLAIIITCFNVGYFAKDEFFYNIENLPTGKLLRNDFTQEVLFSTGWSLDVYEIEQTRDHPAAIRIVAKNDKTHESRTIYWQINERATAITWLNNTYEETDGSNYDEIDYGEIIVTINDVPINIITGHYDCRDYQNFKYVP